jgi:hypothetical protein
VYSQKFASIEPKMFLFITALSILITVNMSNSQSNKKLDELLWIIDNWVSAEVETVWLNTGRKK